MRRALPLFLSSSIPSIRKEHHGDSRYCKAQKKEDPESIVFNIKVNCQNYDLSDEEPKVSLTGFGQARKRAWGN